MGLLNFVNIARFSFMAVNAVLDDELLYLSKRTFHRNYGKDTNRRSCNVIGHEVVHPYTCMVSTYYLLCFAISISKRCWKILRYYLKYNSLIGSFPSLAYLYWNINIWLSSISFNAKFIRKWQKQPRFILSRAIFRLFCFNIAQFTKRQPRQRSTFVYTLIILIKSTKLFVSVCAYMRVVFCKVNALLHSGKKENHISAAMNKKIISTLCKVWPVHRIYVVSFYVLE